MKQLMGRRRLIKHTEMRDGAVYRTALLGELWVKVGIGTEWEQRVAKEAGGDELGSCPYDGRSHIQSIDTEKLWIMCSDVSP
jgi:hypothetical protein